MVRLIRFLNVVINAVIITIKSPSDMFCMFGNEN